MKNFILILFLFLAVCSRGAFAQDLIVTLEGDSLNCRITKIDKEAVHFTFLHKDEVRKTLLMKTQIQHYEQDYYLTGILPVGAQAGYMGQFPRFRVAASGGWSYRTAPVSDNIPHQLKEYVHDLKSGYSYGVEASYFFSEQMGIGFKYTVHCSQAQINNVMATLSDGTTVYGKLSDDIRSTFVGPAFSSRMLSENMLNAFSFTVGLGYLGYENKAVFINPIEYTGSTVGFVLDIGYDFRISKDFSLGVQLSMLSGILNSYEENDGMSRRTRQLQGNDRESLSRIDLSIGLRFNR